MTENSLRESVLTEPLPKKALDYNPKVSAIRNGKLVTVLWSELTADERRAALCNLFSIYG